MAKQKTTEKTSRQASPAIRIVVLFTALLLAGGGVVAVDNTAAVSAADAPLPVAPAAVEEPVAEAAAAVSVEPTAEAEVAAAAAAAGEAVAAAAVVRELDYGTACDTPDCAALLTTYGLAGLSHRGDGDTYVPVGKVREVLAAYAALLGGPDQFAERVAGEGGVQYLVFDFSHRGNYAGQFFAVYCPAQRVESCTGGTKAGTLFLNMTHNTTELKTTLAHEFTHALDFKAELASVETFRRVGGNDAITLKDRDYENHAELIAQYLFPTGGATPAPATWDSLLHQYINICFVPHNFRCEIS